MSQNQIQSSLFFVDRRQAAAREDHEDSQDQRHVRKEPHGQILGWMRDPIQVSAHGAEKELEILRHFFDFFLFFLHDVVGKDHGPGDEKESQAPNENRAGRALHGISKDRDQRGSFPSPS